MARGWRAVWLTEQLLGAGRGGAGRRRNSPLCDGHLAARPGFEGRRSFIFLVVIFMCLRMNALISGEGRGRAGPGRPLGVGVGMRRVSRSDVAYADRKLSGMVFITLVRRANVLTAGRQDREEVARLVVAQLCLAVLVL